MVRAVSASRHRRFGTCCHLISRTVMLVANSSSWALRLGSLCKPTHKRRLWELCLSGALQTLDLIWFDWLIDWLIDWSIDWLIHLGLSHFIHVRFSETTFGTDLHDPLQSLLTAGTVLVDDRLYNIINDNDDNNNWTDIIHRRRKHCAPFDTRWISSDYCDFTRVFGPERRVPKSHSNSFSSCSFIHSLIHSLYHDIRQNADVYRVSNVTLNVVEMY